MKKKIFSILLGICLVFSGLMSFSGCSIYTKDNEKVNAEVMMRIGNTNVTKNDLYSAFYTYYQNNSTYFAYYSSDLIEESFYTWFTVKTLVSELSVKALEDDTIYYTNEDADEVWGYVEDYFYSQVSSYEKTLYDDEKDYPEWLQSDDDEDEEESKFESYVSSSHEVKETLKKDRKADKTTKLTDEEVYGKVSALLANLFKYQIGDDETKRDMGEKGTEVYKKREQAYGKYKEALRLNAKASGNKATESDLIKAEVLRIYNAYYESQISVIFQNYYMQEYLLNEDKTSLGDRAIVSKFLDEYYKEQQVNSVYDEYVEVMEDDEGASLVLYHYNGATYYFSVQHILIAFDEELSAGVQALPFYSSDDSIRGTEEDEIFVAARQEFANDNLDGILVEIDKTREKNTLKTVCNYYYYDEGRKDLYDATVDGSTAKIYNGYVQLTTRNDVTGEYEWHAYTSSDGSEISDDDGVKASGFGVKKMANLEDVKEAIQVNYNTWKGYALEVYNGTKTIDEICTANDGELEDLRYVLEVAKNYKDCGLSENELKVKIGSLVFIELEWLYSGDSLGNEMSNKIGYIVHSELDEDLSWVTPFADGARELLNYMNSDDFSLGRTEDEQADYKATYTNGYVTNYGYHLIKIENVYTGENSSIVDLSSITDKFSLEENSNYVKSVAKLLKKTYVCSSSNETLYDHFYDEVYNSLVGTSSSSGTYFLKLEYEWLSNYNKAGNIEILKTLSYDELLDSIS